LQLWFRLTTFNEQLAILQRTATTVLMLYCSVVPKPERNHLIDSGMPFFWWSAGMHWQHTQLATSENLTTLSILTAPFSRNLQIRGIGFASRAPLFVIFSPFGRFKSFKTVGEP
jgi:hypothetical protein